MAISSTLLGVSNFAGNFRLEFHAKPSGVKAKLWRDTVKVGTYFLENFQNPTAMTYETLPTTVQLQISRFLTLHNVQIQRDGVTFNVNRAPSPFASPMLSPIQSPPPFEIDLVGTPSPEGLNIEELNESLVLLRSLKLGPIPPENSGNQRPSMLSDEDLAQITECMLNPPVESFAVECNIDEVTLFFPRPEMPPSPPEPGNDIAQVSTKGPFDGVFPSLINSRIVSFHRCNCCKYFYDFEKGNFVDGQVEADHAFLSAAVSNSHAIMKSDNRVAITADLSGSLKIWDVHQIDQCDIELQNALSCRPRVDDDGRITTQPFCEDEIVLGIEKIAILKPDGQLHIWDLPTRTRILSLSKEQVLQYDLAYQDFDDENRCRISFHDDRILIQSLKRQERTGRFVQQLFFLELNPLNLRQHLFAPEEVFVRIYQGRVLTIFGQSLYFSELCSHDPRTFFMQLGFDVKKFYLCDNVIVFISPTNTIHVLDIAEERKTELVAPGLDINYDLVYGANIFEGKLFFLENLVQKFKIHIFDLTPQATTMGLNTSGGGSASSS